MDQSAPTLLGTIDSFLAEHEMSAVTFGRMAMNDPHFVRDLRAGRDVKVSTVDRLNTFMTAFAARDAA